MSKINGATLTLHLELYEDDMKAIARVPGDGEEPEYPIYAKLTKVIREVVKDTFKNGELRVDWEITGRLPDKYINLLDDDMEPASVLWHIAKDNYGVLEQLADV